MRSPKDIIIGISMMILMGLISLFPSVPVYGMTCRTYGTEEICLVSIKRSAKYHWEYRAVLQINGQKQAQKLFDCRHNLEGANSQRKFVCSLIPQHEYSS